MQYASRMSAKVVSAAIQAGYQLYHHAFFADKNGEWAVIQQGMCPDDRTARRYHWLSEKTGCFVVEPHNAIVGDAKREVALDMTARDSEECRKASLDIAKETPKRTMRLVMTLRPLEQKSLQEWIPDASQKSLHAHLIGSLSMPRNMNWKALEKVYEFQPRSYEDLLGFRGVGPATVRGLALIAELIYGKEPSWKDPVKYSFAYGGKDDVPHPVDRKAMDESVLVLRQAIIQARLGQKERLYSLRRLRRFVPADML